MRLTFQRSVKNVGNMGNWGGTNNFSCNPNSFIQEINHCTLYWLSFGINNTIKWLIWSLFFLTIQLKGSNKRNLRSQEDFFEKCVKNEMKKLTFLREKIFSLVRAFVRPCVRSRLKHFPLAGNCLFVRAFVRTCVRAKAHFHFLF